MRDHNVNKNFYKHVLCHPANNNSVFLIFVSIQKPTNTFNRLTNSIYEIYIFCFSYIFYFIVNLFFIGKQILTYLLTYLLTYRLHQQRCQVNFLSYVFVTSRNLLFGVFLPKKIITILRKIAVSVRQVSVRGVLLSVSILECFGKIFQKCL